MRKSGPTRERPIRRRLEKNIRAVHSIWAHLQAKERYPFDCTVEKACKQSANARRQRSGRRSLGPRGATRMGPSEPRRRCDSRLARIPQGVAPSRGTQPHSDGGWPTIDMEGLGRGPWSKTEEKTVNGGRSRRGRPCWARRGERVRSRAKLSWCTRQQDGLFWRRGRARAGTGRLAESDAVRRATPSKFRFEKRNRRPKENACMHARGDEGM